MASLLCLLFGSLNAKHNSFPSTTGLFILSNKTFRVLFLIAASSSSAIGRLIFPINLRHGIDNVKSRNVFIACIRARFSPSDSSLHCSFIRMQNLFAIARRRSPIESRSKIASRRGSCETLTLELNRENQRNRSETLARALVSRLTNSVFFRQSKSIAGNRFLIQIFTMPSNLKLSRPNGFDGKIYQLYVTTWIHCLQPYTHLLQLIKRADEHCMCIYAIF